MEKTKRLQELKNWVAKNNKLPGDNKLQELKAWVAKNNRLPSQHSKDPSERSLRNWMNSHKSLGTLKQFIAIFKHRVVFPELWELEISEA